jgi:hypothetical protein
MSSSNSKPSPKTPSSRSVLQTIGAVLDGTLTFIRKAPIVALFAVLAVVLYLRHDDQAPDKELGKFSPPSEMEREPEIPADFPKDANPAVLSCVHKVNADLDKSLWAEVYYGMEARLDGKYVVAKMTAEWQTLSDDKRTTVVQVIVDTWAQHAETLKILTSRDEMEEVVIKRVADDQTVATWKPAVGVQLMKPQPEVAKEVKHEE